jgi:hypothetical protein
MGFVRMIAEGGSPRPLERLIGKDSVTSLPGRARLRAARQEEAEALARVRSIEPAAEISGAKIGVNPAVPALAAAKQRLVVAQQELNSMELRPLACYEQDELLFEAIATTKRALIVTSAGLQPTVLTQHMLRDLDRLAAERVSIQIASFLRPQTEARGGDHYDPLAELTKRSQRNSMQLVQVSRADFFFLLQDDDLAVVSNRPFLGEMVRRSGFQRVEGYVTRHRTMVDKIREMAANACRPRKNG